MNAKNRIISHFKKKKHLLLVKRKKGCTLTFVRLWEHRLACEEALRGALAAGGKRNESLEFELHLQFPCGSPSTELSDFRQSVRSGKEREIVNNNWKTRANGNDVITNVVSAGQHFASTQIFNFQRRRALTICMENPEIPRRIQMERFIPVEIFRKKSITFFPFIPKRPKFSAPYVWITSARL